MWIVKTKRTLVIPSTIVTDVLDTGGEFVD